MPAKKRKYPKLPSGFGSIRKLPGNRRNPYCVQPTSQGLDINGCPIRPKPLCYVDNWYKGFAVLTAYNAGTYIAGMENDINISHSDIPTESINDIVKQMLNNYALITQRITGKETETKRTFADVYNEFFDDKYNHSQKQYSLSAKNATITAFKNISALHDRPFKDLRYIDLQEAVDKCPLRHASLEHIVSLLKQMYRFAIVREYTDKNYAEFVKISKPDDDEHGVPFTEKDIVKLWQDKDDPIAELLLIMIYSGHRISEYKVIEVDLKNKCYIGGLKTKAGKSRIVPIHSAILPLIKKRLKREKAILKGNIHRCREKIEKYSETHGMGFHTPHDTRHTFAMLCDKFEVRETDKKRLLGHSLSGDVTNSVYGHRSLDELRKEIEKIKAPDFVTNV